MIRKVYGEDEKIPGECPYDRCSYVGCKNGKYRNYRKLFLFPRHTEPERLEKWLQNSGNTELRKKAYSSIRRSGICADHFDDSCFSDHTKYFLKRNSVPLSNYPPNLGNNSSNDHSSLNESDRISNTNVNSTTITTINVSTTKTNASVLKTGTQLPTKEVIRAPKLFEDYDDNFGESDNESCGTFGVKEEKITSELENTNDVQEDSIPTWKKYEVFLSEDESEQLLKNISSDAENSINALNTAETSFQDQYTIAEDAGNEEIELLEELSPASRGNTGVIDASGIAPTINTIKTVSGVNLTTISTAENVTRTIIDTRGASIELIRKLNEEFNKDELIAKLRRQNSILRKEIRRIKNLERLRKQRKAQKGVTKKKMSLKEQKKLILETVNEMNISPVSKAIISLQLHTKNAPYTEEEKNLATEFLLYSRSGFKRLKTAGLNFPSTSSLKRWVKSIHMEEDDIEEFEEEHIVEADSPSFLEDSEKLNAET